MLEHIKNFAAEMLQRASSKEDIQAATKLNNLIEEAEKDVSKIKDENKEYLEMVKELAKHSQFKEAPKEPTQEAPRTFEDQLAAFIQSENAKK